MDDATDTRLMTSAPASSTVPGADDADTPIRAATSTAAVVLRAGLSPTIPATPMANGRPSYPACRASPRPCPWASCQYHLLADVTEGGALKVTGRRKTLPLRESRRSVIEEFIDDAVDTLELMDETCALDVADRGAHSIEQIADIMGLSNQRISQMVKTMLAMVEPLRGDE